MAAPDEAPTTPGRSRRAPLETRAIVVAIDCGIARADIAGLCDRMRTLLQDSGADLLVCDVNAVVDPDAVTVDALARLQLTARRLGCRVGVSRARPELRDLLDLMGLRDVVPLCGGSGLEPRGEAEQGEPPGGIQEEDDPGDPVSRDVDDLK